MGTARALGGATIRTFDRVFGGAAPRARLARAFLGLGLGGESFFALVFFFAPVFFAPDVFLRRLATMAER